MKYEFIVARQEEFAIRVMCRVLAVSPSGYYAWVGRPSSQRQQENERLTAQIRQLHQPSRQTYGSPRIHADLQAMGIQICRKRVARLMRSTAYRRGRSGATRPPPSAKHRVPPHRACWHRISMLKM